jgi:hypothetical protein
VGCSQNSLTSAKGAPLGECPQVEGASTHSRSQAISIASRQHPLLPPNPDLQRGEIRPCLVDRLASAQRHRHRAFTQRPRGRPGSWMPAASEQTPGADLSVVGTAYAAEAEVRHRGVDHLRLSRRGPAAQAVVGSTDVRAALDHPARDLRTGFPGRGVRAIRAGHARVVGHAAGMLCLVGMAGREPVNRPFPNIGP